MRSSSTRIPFFPLAAVSSTRSAIQVDEAAYTKSSVAREVCYARAGHIFARPLMPRAPSQPMCAAPCSRCRFPLPPLPLPPRSRRRARTRAKPGTRGSAAAAVDPGRAGGRGRRATSRGAAGGHLRPAARAAHARGAPLSGASLSAGLCSRHPCAVPRRGSLP